MKVKAFKIVGILLVSFVGGMCSHYLLMWSGMSISARQFRLVGENGEDCGGLMVGSDGISGLVLRDESGQQRVTLALSPKKGAYLRLTAKDGTQKGSFVVGADGVSYLNLFGKSGKNLIDLTSGLGGASLTMHDTNDKIRVFLAIPPAGGPGLILYDENERRRGAMGIDRTGQEYLMMFDASEKPTWEALPDKERVSATPTN